MLILRGKTDSKLKLMNKTIFISIILLSGNLFSSEYSFRASKKEAARAWGTSGYTFYCNCPYKGKVVDVKSCGLKVPSHKKRATRLEWEHVVPASSFGQSFDSWRSGHPKCTKYNKKTKKFTKFKGRRCARLVSEKFRQMETDINNLVPVVGAINAARSNYSFSIIPGEKREWGTCDIEIENRKIEPRPEVRRKIAQIYSYMDKTYPGHGILSNKNRKLFEEWVK